MQQDQPIAWPELWALRGSQRHWARKKKIYIRNRCQGSKVRGRTPSLNAPHVQNAGLHTLTSHVVEYSQGVPDKVAGERRQSSACFQQYRLWMKIRPAVLCHPVTSHLLPPLGPFVGFSVVPAIPRTGCVAVMCACKTHWIHNECHFSPALEHRFVFCFFLTWVAHSVRWISKHEYDLEQIQSLRILLQPLNLSDQAERGTSQRAATPAVALKQFL